MLNETVNRLRGQIHVRVECAFPERVLNLCGARNLSFWDLEWESPTTFTCRISRRDYQTLRRAVKPLECMLTVVRREGAPYFLLRFRRRQALLMGLVGCGLALFLGSFFIWEFEIEGNETVPETRILRALEQNGVGIGSFGLSLNGEDLRNHVLLDVPELCWISVNVSGCKAKVQVRERQLRPELLDEQTPMNVAARRGGMVLRVRAAEGVTCVRPGDSVAEGDLLISGIEDTDTFGARVVAGMGSVEARTWHTLTTRIPLTAEKKSQEVKTRRKLSLIFGKERVKFYANSSVQGANYDKITRRHRCALLGIPLPLTIVTETYRFYETESAVLDEVAAETLGKEILTEQLTRTVSPYGTVRSTLCTSRRQGDALLVTLTAECEEEIGHRVPILTEESGESPS